MACCRGTCVTQSLLLLLGLGQLMGQLGGVDANLRKPRNSKLPPESWMSTTELIGHWGYPQESHTIVTEDGYIIDIHRVPSGRGQFKKRGPQGKVPVLIMAGYAASSECLVLREHDNLAFTLANLGFDVWLGNTRGNFYGRRHVSLPMTDERFWDYSWHENGVYDLAAEIDYILNTTEQTSLFFVGHSMGATALITLLSERPEYNAKVRANFMLAPAAYFYYPRGLFLDIKRNLAWAERSYSALKMENPLTRYPSPQLCLTLDGSKVSRTCDLLMAHVQGPFHNSKNNTYYPLFLQHFPAGSAFSEIMHYVQAVIRGGSFLKYDHGPQENLKRYGSFTPPPYNLDNVVSPTYMFYSENDHLAHYKDVKRLALDIAGTAGLFKVPAKYFNHLDIMYDESAANLVFKRVIEKMRKHV